MAPPHSYLPAALFALCACTVVAAANVPITTCRSFCGNITVDYPFALHPGCGHAGLRDLLFCINGALMLHLPSGSYRVLDVDYAYRGLTLHEPAMSDCRALDRTPAGRGNGFVVEPWREPYLSPDPDNVFLLLGCRATSPLFQGFPDRHLPCRNVSGMGCEDYLACPAWDDYYAGEARRRAPGDDAPECCGVPWAAIRGVNVSRLECEGYSSAYSLAPVRAEGGAEGWAYGIRASWALPESNRGFCGACRATGGACGHDMDSHADLCLCGDWNSTSNCDSSADAATSGAADAAVRGVVLATDIRGLATAAGGGARRQRRILVDTDVDTDDVFAILYLLKHDHSEFDLKAVTISANAWSDSGHAVNHLYDLLYMMGRDDIAVGVGGDGGISEDGTIYPNVGGYFAIIEQEMTTVGGCRYRQTIPQVGNGRLDVNTNYGIRRAFLPQGNWRYLPLQQPTTQQIIIDTITAGRTTIFLMGIHTNFALFLMSNPHLKKNVEHIYIMGGGVRSHNPTGCCSKSSISCVTQQCEDHGNMFTAYTKDPYAEFNIFGDPFGAYQVFHSGIPITLVPLDATNTIPITEDFFKAFEQMQNTYEAKYCFQSLKIARDTWFDNQFYTSYFMWDSFMTGVALSIMHNGERPNGENEFSEMQVMNITVVTSNEPYDVHDGSNPLFDGHVRPKFNLLEGGIHSGHVLTGLDDPFCVMEGGVKGKCQDGYTKEVQGPDSVAALVAVKAKPNRNANSPLDRQFFNNFLEVLNRPAHSGLFNFTNIFPHYKEVMYKPDFRNRTRGMPVIFDMDMSPGDFIALLCLLKVNIEAIDLKEILVSGNGWSNPATIDVIYDVIHMMGRDDIPVGLGSVTALGAPELGCEYVKAIPHGSGGLLDTGTLFGLARMLPRSPRRYTAENSMKYGAPRDTSHPELRQPLAFEVWQQVIAELEPIDKITVLTNGPLTNIANVILSDTKAKSMIEQIYIVVTHLVDGEEGNLFTVPSNKFAEFNIFLDPKAAKTVVESSLDITVIPLRAQRQVSSLGKALKSLRSAEKTPESSFVYRLLLLMQKLQKKHQTYSHIDMFLGEILGSMFLVRQSHLNCSITEKAISVDTGHVSMDGQTILDETNGKPAKVLDRLDSDAYYTELAKLLATKKQSALVGSFDEQKRMWSKTNYKGRGDPGVVK